MTTTLETKIRKLEDELLKLVADLEPQDQTGTNVKLQIQEQLARLFGDLYWWT